MAFNVVGDLRLRIEEALETPAYVHVPKDRVLPLITVNREGGHNLNKLLDRPGIGIYCYGRSEEEAWQIAERVAALFKSLTYADGYEVVEQEQMRSDPDPDTRENRWYLSYTITTHNPIGG